MNKYQEAYKRCESVFVSLAMEDSLGKLNHQEEVALFSIKELVDKETPKKVIKVPYKDIYGNEILDSKSHFYNGCPVCKGNVGIDANYCRHCGQKLDWSDEDGNS